MSYVKYPRTPHFSFSPGVGDDDIITTSDFLDGDVVVTEKIDGENCTMYDDHIHARSISSANHSSRDWVRKFWAENVKHHIPHGMRVCGENVYAVHSIEYTDLSSYFLGFNIWEGDKCLSWDSTLEWFELLNIRHVPVLYRGFYADEMVKVMAENVIARGGEGVVVRVAREFTRDEFKNCVRKYVRKGHVQTDDHWMSKPVVPNKLGEK